VSAATPCRSLRAKLARWRLDVTPMRTSRDFRLLFVAGTIFYLGGMVSYVALPFQVYQLTGSNFAVGAVGLVELVPLVVFGLYGGALADHLDRRTMLVATGIAVAWAYAVDVAGLVAATGLFMALRRYPPTDRSPAPSIGAIWPRRRRGCGSSGRTTRASTRTRSASERAALPLRHFPRRNGASHGVHTFGSTG